MESRGATPQGPLGSGTPAAPAAMAVPQAVDLPPSVVPPPVPELAVNTKSPGEEKEGKGPTDKLEDMASGTTQMDIAQSQPYSNPMLTPGQPSIGMTSSTPAGSGAPVMVPTTTTPTVAPTMGGATAPPAAPTAAPELKKLTPLPPVQTIDILGDQVTDRLPPILYPNVGGDMAVYVAKRRAAQDAIDAATYGKREVPSETAIAAPVKAMKAAWRALIAGMPTSSAPDVPAGRVLNDYRGTEGYDPPPKSPNPAGELRLSDYDARLGPQTVTYYKVNKIQVYNTPIELKGDEQVATRDAILQYNKDLKFAQGGVVGKVENYRKVQQDAIAVQNARMTDLDLANQQILSDATATPAPTAPEAGTTPAPTPSSNSALPAQTPADTSGLPPLHDSANPTLRAQFEEAEPADVIPSEKDQLTSDIIFDAFDEVAPGFGLGISNKLFVENELRERKLRHVDNFFPRPDPGVPTGVTPPPWQLQEVLPVSLVKSFFDKVETRMASMEKTIQNSLAIGKTVHTLPDEVRAVPSSKGLLRPASILEPVNNNIQRWLPTFDPAGVYLNQRGLRHLHSPWNHPYEAEEDSVNSGPTLRRRRSLAINLP